MRCGLPPPRMPAPPALPISPTRPVDTDVQTIAASDALLRLDGTTITRDSNTITDLLDGMKLTLNSTSSTASLVTSRYDTPTATAAMQLVIDGLNGMNEMLGSMSKRGVVARRTALLPATRLSVRCNASFAITPQHRWPDFRTIRCIWPISASKQRVTAPFAGPGRLSPDFRSQSGQFRRRYQQPHHKFKRAGQRVGTPEHSPQTGSIHSISPPMAAPRSTAMP